MNEIKIVIEDRDDNNAVLGVITLVENTLEEFEKALQTYKDENEDCWYWEGFLDYLVDLDWKFDWENDVSTLEV